MTLQSNSTPVSLERSSGLPTEGMHLFKVTSCKEMANANTGDPQWVAEFTCQDAGDDQGKKMSVFMQTVGNGRFVLDNFFDALELPKKGTATPEQMVGKLLKIYVVHREYNGSMRANAYTMLPKNSTAVVEVKKTASQSNGTLPTDTTKTKNPF